MVIVGGNFKLFRQIYYQEQFDENKNLYINNKRTS